MLITKMSLTSFSPKQPAREQLANFWKIFFDVQYFLLCSPFRMRMQPIEKSLPMVVASSWLPQKVSCGIFTILGLLFLAARMHQAVPTDRKDPSMYLFISFRVTTTLFTVGRVWLFWWDQARLLDIFNFILRNQHILPDPKIALIKFIFQTKMGKIAFFIIGCLLLTITTGYSVIENWPSILQMWKETYLSDNYPSASVQKIVEMLTCLGYIWAHLMGFSHELFMLLVVIIVWLPAKGFAEQLCSTQLFTRDRDPNAVNIFSLDATGNICKGTHESWFQVRNHYCAIKKLTAMVNRVFGWVQFCFLLETVLYYSVRFDEMFLERQNKLNWCDIPVNIYFLMITMTAFLLSADVCKQVYIFT